MKKIIAVLCLITPMFYASSASAGSDSGLGLSLRLGYGLPLGEVQKESKLSDAVTGEIPVVLSVGYRINPNIYVGGLMQYGMAFVKDCPDGASCSAYDMRLGIEGIYNIMPDANISPWVGIGLGYEILHGSRDDYSGSSKGLEFINLQAGGDFKLSPMFLIGPYVSCSVGQYSSWSSEGQSGDIEEKSIHEWLQVGVKATMNL